MTSPHGIDLILGADSIRPPLTGIGRYALELARRLPGAPGVGRVRFYGLGQWLDTPALEAADTPRPAGEPTRTLRSTLAANPHAVRAFAALMPLLQRWQLRAEETALFHSPNFFLPPVRGRSVVTVHDLSHHLYPQFHPPARIDYMQRMLPRSIARAGHIITVSESARQDTIAHLGVAPGRVTAIPLGVQPQMRPHSDAELAPALARLGLTAQGYTLFVGTIEPRKNLDRLLAAYAMLPSALRQHYPLVLAGSRGWHSEATHSRMEQAASAGWLRYLRFVSQADLPALYAGAALFTYPSLYEGFGLPVLEAMASGVPVVTSTVSSLPEVAGDAALTIDPNDEHALATSLARGLQDSPWRTQARARGLARASGFTWQRCTQETVAVYARTMSA